MHSIFIKYKKNKTLIWVSIFAICMGMFEGSVVVYLRALYYPNGFDFPVTLIDQHIALTELIRELASLFMLLSIGIISGKNFTERFAWFIYSFAVWDIIYYIFLFLILGWPPSIFTWDILFLIPVMWTGPVIAPIILSLLMILLSLIVYQFNQQSKIRFNILKHDWLVLIAGSIIIFIAFILDYCKFIIHNITFSDFNFDLLSSLSLKYIPESFNWALFTVGFFVISAGIFSVYISGKNN